MYIEWLREKVNKNSWGKNEFMLWNNDDYNYEWLFEKVSYYSDILKKEGVISSSIVALDGNHSPYVVSLLLALVENKNIIVPIYSNVKDKKEFYVKTSQAEFSLSMDETGGLSVNKHAVTVNHELLKKLQDSKNSGLILFTSGSTGIPKAALHNLDRFLETYTRPKKAMRALVFLNLDHIGGINTLFSFLSNSGTMIVIKERDPASICKAIERYKAELLPATPSFLNILLISESNKDYNLSSLKLITYGTEVMPESLLKRLKGVFPLVEFKQTYGMTEVGILKTKSESSDSPWVKIGGEDYEIKIAEGILWIRSRTSILGYLNAPNPFTQDGWLITNDRVEVKGEYFKFLGRKGEIINVGGLKMYPAEVENIILGMENVSDVVVSSEKNPILGNIVLAKVILKNSEFPEVFKKRLHEFCKQKIERYKIPQKIEISDASFVNERFKKIR